ncbi:MAG: ABC transporter ATP-binding protein, partial [Pseudomonadota bacterium]
ILWLIDRLKRDTGTSVLFITHDLGVVAQIADRVVVMARGDFIESGSVEDVFSAPKAPYTRRLLAAVPRLGTESGRTPKAAEPHLRIENLTVRYPIKSGLLRRVRAEVLAVDRVSLEIPAGETLGLVGESGCGKSTIAKAILGLEPPTEGRITVDGTDIGGLDAEGRRALQRSTGMVFQDPFAALSPRRTAFQQISEPMVIHRTGSRAEIGERVRWLIQRVGLEDRHLERYPHEFSGGQRQRLCIARALALEPRLVIADEPVSALDVSVQAQVLDLFAELQSELGLTYLFISHDLAIVEKVSDRVAVMHMGRVVEYGATACVLSDPQHAYTQNLLSAVPVPDPGRRLEEPRLYRAGRQTPMIPRGTPLSDAPQYRRHADTHFVLETA